MASTIGLFPRFLDPINIQILRGSRFSLESSQGLEVLLNTLFPQGNIQALDVEQLKFSEKPPKQTLLVLPGSIDIKTWQIPEIEQKSIECLCKNGMLKVLGVCAGAFYVSQEIVYDGVKKVHDNRSIQLFKGSCSGPFLTHSQPSELSIRVRVEQIFVDHKPLDVAVNGGGWFIPDSDLVQGRDYVVLANYDNEERSIAAVACVPASSESNYNALLIGPHFEYEKKNFQALAAWLPEHQVADNKKEALAKMGERIEASLDARIQAMHFFLSKLGFK